jgi:molecular chaperone GrpE (heat shock protein)
MTGQQSAALGEMLGGHMEEEMGYHDKDRAELMKEMASECGHSRSHMNAIARGDVMCPSIDAIEAMSEVLDADMGKLVEAAEEDGCEYSMQGGHEEDEDMANTAKMSERQAKAKVTELEAQLSDLQEKYERVSERAAAVDEATDAFAEALAEYQPEGITSEMLAEKHDLADLQEMLEAVDGADVTEATESEPTVRSGSSGTQTEAESLAPGDREKVTELREELSKWEDRDSRLANAEQDRIESKLAELEDN